MSGASSGLQVRLKDAHFVHCYAHQLNLIMQQACSSLTPIRIFFGNISAFVTFFSKSPKRTAVLDEVCGRRTPASGKTRWNFKSRTAHTVFEHQDNLKQWKNPEWWIMGQRVNPTSPRPICDAGGCKLYFLSLFHSALLHVDILYSILQKQNMDPLKTRQALENFSCSIAELKEKLTADDTQVHPDADTAAAATPRRRRRSENVSVAAQCCEIMMEQSKACSGKARHLLSFELTDPELCPLFKTSFQRKQLDIASEHFPMICKEKLKGELIVMYSLWG